MEEVIAVSFHDRRRAAQAFNLLWQMNDKLVIELDDAVIVHRDHDGNLEYDQQFTSTLDRRLVRAGIWGGVLGAFVAVSFAVGANAIPDLTAFSACVLAGALIGVVAGAFDATADAAWWKDHPSAAKDLVPEVIDDIRPGESAVVAWVDSAGLELAAPALRGFGGDVVCTTLPPAEIAKLQAILKKGLI